MIAKDCPPVKALIQMTIALPGSWGDGRGITLHGEGTVVRGVGAESATASGSSSEFAASVQFYAERSGSEDRPDQNALAARFHTH